MTTSSAGFPSVLCMSTGMPRPLSTTETVSSASMATVICVQ